MFSKLLHRAHSYAKRTRLLSRGIHALGYGRVRRKRSYRYRKRIRGYGRINKTTIPLEVSLARQAALGHSGSSWMPSMSTLGKVAGTIAGLTALKYGGPTAVRLAQSYGPSLIQSIPSLKRSRKSRRRREF